MKHIILIITIVATFILCAACNDGAPNVPNTTPAPETSTPQVIAAPRPPPPRIGTPATPKPTQTPIPTVAPLPSNYLDVFRAAVSDFNENQESFFVRKTEFGGYSTEGGYVTGYYRNGTIATIQAELFGETGKAVESIYFSDALIFIQRKLIYYKEPIYVNSNVEIASTEYTEYVLQGNFLYLIEDTGAATAMSTAESQYCVKYIDACKEELAKWGTPTPLIIQ